MTFPDLMSWIACGMSLLGLWVYGNRSAWGPVIGIVSQVPWTLIGLAAGLNGCIASSAVFAAIHIRNLFKHFRSNQCRNP